ncbi:MAG TPA: DUF2249 domain-containing protein [Bacteroidetes bacterium]|nr:DUF2249 domain-containing protein [Bacteroidota bacterium]
MKITAKTKISQIIKYDKNAIGVIASINKHFRKLKNPVFAKILASRVNVADAAKIGGVSTEEFLKKLQENGYEVEFNQKEKQVSQENKTNTVMEKKNIVTIDVRPVLSGGADPFDEIMETLTGMKEEETLLIINTFEPVPLLNILQKRGYIYQTERPEPGVVYCYLQKAGPVTPTDKVTEVKGNGIDDFDSIETRFKGKLTEIDVREMEMPMPMVTILEALENLREGEALYVHHKRLPQYLLPELESRSYKLVKKPIDKNNLNLIIFK